MKKQITSVLSIAVTLVVMACSLPSSAQEIDMIGKASWDIYPRNRWVADLLIQVEYIKNWRPTPSDVLRLQVWAVNDQAEYLMGSLPLAYLDVGYYYENIYTAVPYRPPPPGLYYTSLLLQEYGTSGFTNVDYVDFEDIVNIGGYAHGSVDVEDVTSPIGFVGPLSWTGQNGRITWDISGIRNSGVKRTNPLAVELWASTQPFDGLYLGNSLRLARRPVAAIKPAQDRQVQNMQSKFVVPRYAGNYYIALVLREHRGNRWVVVDYVNFDQSPF